MSEGNNPVSRERMKRLIASLKEPYKEHESEKRRSLETSSGFYDKLSTLSAGSIAVTASILLAITVKSDIHSGATQIAIHDLLRIAFLLWLSLMLSILHHFMSAQIAKMDAAISENEFTSTMTTLTIGVAQEEMPGLGDDTYAQVEDMVHAQTSPKQQKHVKNRDRLYLWVLWVGYVAAASFVLAYTLVIVYLRHLW
jgi:hypothetical protein